MNVKTILSFLYLILFEIIHQFKQELLVKIVLHYLS